MKDSRLCVEYAFKNENATCGYTAGKIIYPRNPRNEIASEIMRALKAAEESEKKPLIFVGYVLY